LTFPPPLFLLKHAPALLERYFNVPEEGLTAMEIANLYKAVAHDVATIKANPNLVGNVTVSGLVYDVKTGLVETVVAPGVDAYSRQQFENGRPDE